MPRYIDITSCKHGATVVTTVQRVSYRKNTKQIAGSGDGDKVDTFLAKGKSIVTGSINLQDPVQASTLLAATGADLVFEGSEGNDLTKVARVTVKNAIFFDLDGDAPHEDLHGQTIGFRGFATSGASLTVAAATVP